MAVSIDFGSIESKLNAWESSNKGQKKIKQTVNNYVKNGVSKTQAGSEVLSIKKMNELGEDLIQIVRSAAQSSDVPASVQAHFNSLDKGPLIRNTDGSYQMEISFTDDLSRPSLDPHKYGGVTNIVAIFNNGYPKDGSKATAIENVYGWWHGEYIHAKGTREGLNFMQAAVDTFNGKYGAKYDVYVTLDAIYEG